MKVMSGYQIDIGWKSKLSGDLTCNNAYYLINYTLAAINRSSSLC